MGRRHEARLFKHPDPEEQVKNVKYLYTFAVTPVSGDEPVLYVTSEYNRSPAGRSHVMGLFTELGHQHLGSSDEWRREARFLERAVEVVCERLDLGPDEISRVDPQQSREE